MSILSIQNNAVYSLIKPVEANQICYGYLNTYPILRGLVIAINNILMYGDDHKVRLNTKIITKNNIPCLVVNISNYETHRETITTKDANEFAILQGILDTFIIRGMMLPYVGDGIGRISWGKECSSLTSTGGYTFNTGDYPDYNVYSISSKELRRYVGLLKIKNMPKRLSNALVRGFSVLEIDSKGIPVKIGEWNYDKSAFRVVNKTGRYDDNFADEAEDFFSILFNRHFYSSLKKSEYKLTGKEIKKEVKMSADTSDIQYHISERDIESAIEVFSSFADAGVTFSIDGCSCRENPSKDDIRSLFKRAINSARSKVAIRLYEEKIKENEEENKFLREKLAGLKK